MFETIINFFKKFGKHETKETNSKDKAKERLHLVLMQDRANVSADFLEMMKQEIIEVIKKYIEVEENAIDVRLTNEIKEDGTTGAPSLYANIPILNIRNEMKKEVANKENEELERKEENPSEGNKEVEKGKEEIKKEKIDKKEEIKEEIKEENIKEEINDSTETTAEKAEEKQKEVDNKEQSEDNKKKEDEVKQEGIEKKEEEKQEDTNKEE